MAQVESVKIMKMAKMIETNDSKVMLKLQFDFKVGAFFDIPRQKRQVK